MNEKAIQFYGYPPTTQGDGIRIMNIDHMTRLVGRSRDFQLLTIETRIGLCARPLSRLATLALSRRAESGD